MKIYPSALTLCLFMLTQSAFAQRGDKSTNAVKAVINHFFEGMEKGDTALLKSTCTDAPILQTYMADKEGKMMVYDEDFGNFVAFIGAPTKDKYKEVIEFDAVHVEKSLASVWAPYVFYVNGKVSHCGTDSFQLLKTDDGWKIQYILDTRRKQGCR